MIETHPGCLSEGLAWSFLMGNVLLLAGRGVVEDKLDGGVEAELGSRAGARERCFMCNFQL